MPASLLAAMRLGGRRMDLSGVAVLVVEDDPDSRELLAVLLSMCGATVRSAGSARDAVVACDEQTPDIIVSDLWMAGDDGYTFLLTLRRRSACAAVPVIAMTGDEDSREQALAAGFIDFLVKPRLFDVLCERVGHHVAAARMRDSA